MRAGHLDAKNGTHGRLERGAKLELVEARKAALGVHDAVVVVHGEHEPAGESVAIHPGDGGHGVCEEAAVERPEAGDPKVIANLDGVGEVEAVGVEFGQRRGCDDDSRWEAGEFD